MNLKVNNCGECPFKQWDLYARCGHPVKHYEILKDMNIIHKKCPEGGAFEIKTSPITIKIKENKS